MPRVKKKGNDASQLQRGRRVVDNVYIFCMFPFSCSAKAKNKLFLERKKQKDIEHPGFVMPGLYKKRHFVSCASQCALLNARPRLPG